MNARIIPPNMPFALALRLGYTGPIRLPGYVKWIKTLPCDACGANAPSDPSHPNFFKSQKNKAPDPLAIPECRCDHESESMYLAKARYREELPSGRGVPIRGGFLRFCLRNLLTLNVVIRVASPLALEFTFLPHLHAEPLGMADSKNVVIDGEANDVKPKVLVPLDRARPQPSNFRSTDLAFKPEPLYGCRTAGGNSVAALDGWYVGNNWRYCGHPVSLDEQQFSAHSPQHSWGTAHVLQSHANRWRMNVRIADFPINRVEAETTEHQCKERRGAVNGSVSSVPCRLRGYSSDFNGLLGGAPELLGGPPQRTRESRDEDRGERLNDENNPLTKRLFIALAGLYCCAHLSYLSGRYFDEDRLLLGLLLVGLGVLIAGAGLALFALTEFRWSWGWWI